jgi:tRNA 5-methylaminomethyl-2-thiouridine biosynthesis bifunctional protein
MRFVPRSEQFDDVYFSAADGLAETRHVFIGGNTLAERWGTWPEAKEFTICETGFGTGLNFLAALKLWRSFNLKKLHYISFEKYPVTADFIEKSLSHWQDDIGLELSDVLKAYPENLTGTKVFTIDDSLEVTLIFGDVNVELPKVQAQVDTWFLDGFKPSSNPEMWSETVFQNMGHLSNPGATFSTFTAAGFVRRGLAAAGFDVRKVKGFGHKREMSVGVMPCA